jgi:hypothetical protein
MGSSKMIKVIILIGLIKLLVETNKPILCASIYAAVVLIFSMCFSVALIPVLIATGISFVLALIYFWLLNYFVDSILIFWVILVLGLLIGLV